MKKLNGLTSLFFSRFVDKGLRQVAAVDVANVSEDAECPKEKFQVHLQSETSENIHKFCYKNAHK